MFKLLLITVFITVSFLGFTFGKKEIKKVEEMTGNNKIVNFADVREATKNNTVYIIDVREPHELQETGEIPNSLNIPCK